MKTLKHPPIMNISSIIIHIFLKVLALLLPNTE
jgi:hypothetical protein